MSSTNPSRGHVATRNLPRLTSLRAVAALWVFVYHVGHDTSWLSVSRVVGTGYAGVALFFVLSGFVLMWATPGERSATDFWIRRVAKVYPAHLITAATALALPVLAFSPTLKSVVANILLIQAWWPQWGITFSLNAVSWSLSCEIFFYLLSPFIFAAVRSSSLRRSAGFLLGWWFLMLALGIIGSSMLGDIWAYTNPLVRSGDFVLGIMAATALKKGWRPKLPLWAVIFLTGAAILVVDHLAPAQYVSGFALGPVFALLITCLALRDIAELPGLSRHRLLVKAGEVSFAFYLVHELVIFNLSPAFGEDLHSWHTLLAMGTCFIASVLLALALHHWGELPAQRWILKKWSARRRP